MKKVLSVLLCGFVCCGFIFGQNLETKIKESVDSLALRLNFAMDVSIGAIIRDGVNTPGSFSRYIAGKVSHFAANHSLFTVVTLTRGKPSRQGAARQGIISGTYVVRSNVVEITLELTSNNVVINSQSFTVPTAELNRIGITIDPPNNQSVRIRDEVFDKLNIPDTNDKDRPSPAPGNQKALEISAFPNTDTFTYIDGDELKINLISNQNCYFKVYHIDINNKMQLIYPNTANKNNQLRANQQRTIPEAPVRFNVQEPFGQDTILVIASIMQFTDIEVQIESASRNVVIQIQELQDNPSVISGEAATRFSFTSLPSTYYDNTYSYALPANITEAIQSIRSNILQQRGTFNGNESEGTFTVAGTIGNYRVTADAIIFNIRNTGNQLTGSTRSAGSGYRFSIDRPTNMSQAVQSVRSGIERKGGRFEGDEQSGNFSASGIVGQYNVDNRVDIHISQKPLVVPNSMIEREVKNFFGVR